MHLLTRVGAVLGLMPPRLLAVEAKLQAAKRLRRTGLLADKRARVLRAARATYLELECAAQILRSCCSNRIPNPDVNTSPSPQLKKQTSPSPCSTLQLHGLTALCRELEHSMPRMSATCSVCA